MAQLVGRSCTICGQRIATAFEAQWCEGCGAPVHQRCARPGRMGACPTCGTDEATAAEQRRRTEEEATATWRGVRSERAGWGLFHILSGTVLLGLGVASFLLPLLSPGERWHVVWTGAIFVGFAQLLRGIALLLGAARRRPPPR